MNVERIVRWFESGKAEDVANWLVVGWFGLMFFIVGSSVVALVLGK